MSGRSLMWLFVVAVCIVFDSASAQLSKTPSLNCPRIIDNGEYVGQIVGIIDKDEWWRTYIFKPTDESAGCVQLNAPDNEQRTELLLDAYFSDLLIRIKVTGNHEIEAVGLRQKF